MPHHWVIVVPVKELSLAKSRLVGLDPGSRSRLALAMARDVVAASLECHAVHAVYVVTNDVLAATTLEADGARVIADTSDSGLNPALADGARIASTWHPRAGVAALSSDLAALTSAELAEALRAAEDHGRCFLADRSGTGTTLLTAAAGIVLQPAFGPGSRDRHAGIGAVELLGNWPGLRCDVDTPADLEQVLQLKVGGHTAEEIDRREGTR